jgi:hypothetical protein
MATRKFTFISAEGYTEEQGAADELSLGKITLSGVSGVAIDAGGTKIANAAAATTSGDAIVYGQSSASLAGLTLTGNMALGGLYKVTGSAVPTGDADLATKAYVDTLVVTGGQIKEALFAVNQLSDAQGILAAEVLYFTAQPAAGDTVVIKNAGLTRTYTFVANQGAESADTDVSIESSALTAMNRLVTRAMADAANTQWDLAVKANNERLSPSAPSGSVILVWERASAAGLSASRIYGTFATAADASVVRFQTGGVADTDYTRTTAINMPAADPAEGNFGMRRQAAALVDGELHFLLAGNDIYAYDSDADVWNQFSGAGAIPDATSAAGGATKGKITVDEDYSLYVSSGTLRMALLSTGGLQFNAGTPKTLGIKLDSNPGLSVGANGLKGIVEADKGLSIGASGFATVVNTAAAISVDASGLKLLLAADPGLEFDGTNGLRAKIFSTGGLQRTSDGLSVKNAALGGLTSDANGEKIVLEASTPSLQIDGSNQLGVKLDAARAITSGASGIGIALETTNPALAIAGNELDVKYQTLKGLDSDASGLLVKVDGTTISFDGSGNLQALNANESKRIENSVAVDAAVAVGDPLYITATGDRVAKGDTDTDAKSRIIGIARTVQGTVGQTTEVVQVGRCDGVLTGATAGTPYYVATGGGLSTSAPGSGKRVIQVGVALNATDLMVRIVDYGKKA